jgi:hypothetical protein
MGVRLHERRAPAPTLCCVEFGPPDRHAHEPERLACALRSFGHRMSSLDSKVARPGRWKLPPRTARLLLWVAKAALVLVYGGVGLLLLLLFWPSIKNTLDGIGQIEWLGIWMTFLLFVLGKGQERAEKERAEILRLLRGLQAAVDRHPVPKPVIRLPLTGSTSAP